MSRERLLRSNLIGKKIRVGEIKGNIIGESKNMLTVEDGHGRKTRIIKRCHTMEISGIRVEGKDLVGRIDERTRRRR